MYPVLFRIGNFAVSSYGVMVALGFFLAYWTATLEFRRKRLPLGPLQDMLIAAVIGGILGAKLMYIFENIPLQEFLTHPLRYLLERSGLTYFGGFLLGAALVVAVVRARRLPMGQVADALAPGLALAYAIGRIGCLLVGDDYGIPSTLPWAMAFPQGAPPTPPGVRVHPTQIYETLLMGAVFFWLWRWRTRAYRPGWLFGLYLVLAGTERFLIEFIRTTTPSPIPGLTWAQVIALGVALLGLGILYRLRTPSIPSGT